MSTTPQRRYHRFSVDSPVRLAVEGSDRKYDGLCTVVAVGGMGVEVAAKFDIGEVVQVEFVDVTQPPLQAKIVYRNGYEYGLSFLDLV
jgi:PilZ domain